MAERHEIELGEVRCVCIEWPERVSSSMLRRKLICAFPLPLIPSFTSGTMATGVEESCDMEVKFSFGWGAYLYPTLVRVQLSHMIGLNPYSLLHKHETKDSPYAEPG